MKHEFSANQIPYLNPCAHCNPSFGLLSIQPVMPFNTVQGLHVLTTLDEHVIWLCEIREKCQMDIERFVWFCKWV